MEKMHIENTYNVSTYKNKGQKAEQNLAYMLTGEIRKHDKVPFDKGNDIEEFELSVKVEKFTLVSGNYLKATTKAEQIEEYFERTKAKKWAYVTNSNDVYIMDKNEFEFVLERFCGFSKDSKKNGGKYKIKMNRETKIFLEWLDRMAE